MASRGPTTVVETACPLDCPDACRLAVTVHQGKVIEHRRVAQEPGDRRLHLREGPQVRRARVRPRPPAVSRGAQRAARARASSSASSWDEALAAHRRPLSSGAKAERGAASILPFSYGGSNGLLTQDNLDAQLWRRFGTSRLARTVCAAPTGAANMALYGKMPSVTYQDYPEAALIVLWGVNPSASGIHLVPYVREAQKRGAKLVVIDPRTTTLARAADVHLPVRPGTDVVVALAIHRYLFANGLADEAFLREHTHGADRLRERAEPWTIDARREVAGIDPSALERFAELYATSSPALIRCGWGLERNRNGGNAAMAVLALPAVGGKFGVRGGGYSMSNSASWNIDRTWIGTPEPDTRIVNMNHLGRALTEYDDPPVNVLFVYNCNPAATVPDQRRVLRGLEREDLFTVVFEQVMTDTALYADVVLPATTFLEGYDFAKAYGPINMDLARPVDRRGRRGALERRRLRRAVRAARPAGGRRADGRARSDGARARRAAGHDRRRPARGRAARCPPFGTTPIQFVDVFPNTPDRKVDLFPAALDARRADGPLSLPAGSGDRARIRSRSSRRRASARSARRSASCRARRQAADAPGRCAARGLADGDLVRMFNELGEVHCPLTVAPSIRPGTVSLPKGLWRRSTRNGFTGTALVPDTLTDLGGGACFNDARVQVASLATA